MTDTPVRAGSFAEGEFRIGRVFERTFSLLFGNFLIYFVVTAVATVPNLFFLDKSAGRSTDEMMIGGLKLWLGILLAVVLGSLSQAIILYAAFQDMRGRPVSLIESLKIGLSRILWVILLAICVGIGLTFGFILLIVPGIILWTMWFVSTPACVVERLGPFRSMGRSSELTRGHRWKILGMMLLLFLGSIVASGVITASLYAAGGMVISMIGTFIWNAVWGAFNAILVVVTYHDLRVAKEGIDIEQIASVFD